MALENYISFILPDISYMSIKHEKEKKFELPEVGLEPGTSWFKVQHPNHYATGLEAILFLKF